MEGGGGVPPDSPAPERRRTGSGSSRIFRTCPGTDLSRFRLHVHRRGVQAKPKRSGNLQLRSAGDSSGRVLDSATVGETGGVLVSASRRSGSGAGLRLLGRPAGDRSGHDQVSEEVEQWPPRRPHMAFAARSTAGANRRHVPSGAPWRMDGPSTRRMAVEFAPRGVAQPGQSARFGGGRIAGSNPVAPIFDEFRPRLRLSCVASAASTSVRAGS
jgi:hypothetical protein